MNLSASAALELCASFSFKDSTSSCFSSANANNTNSQPLHRPIPPLAQAVHAMVQDVWCLLVTSLVDVKGADGRPAQHTIALMPSKTAIITSPEEEINDATEHKLQDEDEIDAVRGFNPLGSFVFPGSYGLYPSYNADAKLLMFQGPKGACVLDPRTKSKLLTFNPSAEPVKYGEEFAQGCVVLSKSRNKKVNDDDDSDNPTRTFLCMLTLNKNELRQAAITRDANRIYYPFATSITLGEKDDDDHTTWAICPRREDGKLFIGFRRSIAVYDPVTEKLDAGSEIRFSEFRVASIVLLPTTYDCEVAITGLRDHIAGKGKSTVMFLPSVGCHTDLGEDGTDDQQESSPASTTTVPASMIKSLIVRDRRCENYFLGIAVLPSTRGHYEDQTTAPDSWMLALSGVEESMLIVAAPPLGFAGGLEATVLMRVQIVENFGLALCPYSVTKLLPLLAVGTKQDAKKEPAQQE